MSTIQSIGKLFRFLPAAVLAMVTLGAAGPAYAADDVRVVGVEFIPTLITRGATSTLRVKLRNNGAGGQRASVDYPLIVPSGLTAVGHQLGQDCNAAAVTFLAQGTTSGVTLIGLTLLPSGTCTVDVTVSAVETGTYTFTAQNNGLTLSTTLTVVAPAVAESAAISVSQTSIPFPPQEVGVTSSARLATVTNPGGVTVNITGILASNPFAASSECNTVTLVSGASCTFSITFTPALTGAVEGSVQINSNAPTTSIALTGEGIAPMPSLSPAQLSFANTAVNTTATSNVTLMNSNEASAALTVAELTVTGPFSATSDCPGSLAVGSSCTIAVSYSPTTTGEHNGELKVWSLTAASSVVLPLSGTAIVPLTVPGAPTIGTATAGNGQATITFTPPASNGGSAITSYTVTSNPGGFTATGTASPITVGGLTNGTVYTFTVRATNAIGTGAASAASNSVTPATVPGAPTIGAAAPGNGQATVAFTPPASNGGSPITGYTVTSNPGGVTASGAASPITVSGLTNGTAYTFTVTATNALGTGPASAASNSVTSLPALGLSPAGLDFGSQTINTASTTRPVTVSSAGTAPLSIAAIVASGDFNFTGCATPLTLAPGANCTLAIKFLPTADGPRTGAIDISSNAPGSPHAVALTGNGIFAPVPAISATPSSVNLGSIVVGTSATARVAISNAGEADLSIAGISVDGPHFLQSHTCPSVLSPAATCNVVVTYAPTAVGAHSAALRITSNAVPSPLAIPLSGTALPVPVPAMQLSATSVVFDATFLNMVSSPIMVRVTNAGTGPMHISSIATSGDFGYSGCGFPSTILPGDFCLLSITFKPLSEGHLTGSIQIASDAPASPHAIALSGTVVVVLNPAISLAPAALDFGTLRIGSDEVSVMRLTNVGNMALTISAISSAGAMFSQTNNCPASLAAAAFCDIEVTYAPTSVGAHSGQVRIVSNATPSEHIAALSGTGIPVPPAFMVVDTFVDFGQQLTGSVTRAGLAISNTGGRPLVISQMQLFGAPEFGIEGNCAVIEPKENCSVMVLFAPTVAGALAGRIEIVSNHSGGMVTVDLVGLGIARPRADLELSIEGLGFGNQVVGSVSDTRPVGVTNVGNAPLQFLGFDLPLDFSVDSRQCPAQLLPEQSCELFVTFKPVVPGPRGGQLTINSNAIGGPHSVSLTGTGCRFFTMGAARNPARLCSP